LYSLLLVGGLHPLPDQSRNNEIIIGHSVNNRLLLVCFAAQQESIRIFSARKATKQERKDYEENITP
jgi:uncharacterized DUF497 family protein